MTSRMVTILVLTLLLLPLLLSSLPSVDESNSQAQNVTLIPPIELLHILSTYTNDPVIIQDDVVINMNNAMMRKIPSPDPPLHRASPPGRDAVIGLAAFKSFSNGFRRLIGSLRSTLYDGHILLGVHKEISASEIDFLKRMDVTIYIVDFVDCDKSILEDGEQTKGAIRGKCSKGLETLKLEWGRYEMARQWLADCDDCTGWNIVMDTRDLFFQDHPFRGLGDPISSPINLYFSEEISPNTSVDTNPIRSFVAGNPRSFSHVVPCYGRDKYMIYEKRAVLCSGTIIGNKLGINRFLSILVHEFYQNNEKSNLKCRSPHTTDQWTMNYLYYNGYFGDNAKTITLPWGMGPVLTVGKACITKDRKTGATDLVPRNHEGFLLNLFDNNNIAPIVHQFDRCQKWIGDFFSLHPDIFRIDYEKSKVPWLVQT